jgi:hypothetical protein
MQIKREGACQDGSGGGGMGATVTDPPRDATWGMNEGIRH